MIGFEHFYGSVILIWWMCAGYITSRAICD